MKKSTKCIIILIVMLGIAFCVANTERILKSIVKWIDDYSDSRKELPSFGEYICPELDLCLTFNEHERYVVSPDYKTKVNVDFGGRMLWDGSVTAFYYWNKRKNVIEISFGRPPSGASKDVTYIFVPQDGS